jgi:hypothetical protein
MSFPSMAAATLEASSPRLKAAASSAIRGAEVTHIGAPERPDVFRSYSCWIDSTYSTKATMRARTNSSAL